MKTEVKKYFKLNENENEIFQNFLKSLNAVVSGHILALKSHFTKQKRLHALTSILSNWEIKNRLNPK